MTARTLVLGDWGRVVRDPTDLLRVAFFVGAVVFAVLGELRGVANLLVGGGALILARAVNLPRLYYLGFTIAMILTGWGRGARVVRRMEAVRRGLRPLRPAFGRTPLSYSLRGADALLAGGLHRAGADRGIARHARGLVSMRAPRDSVRPRPTDESQARLASCNLLCDSAGGCGRPTS
jgi:hypothetical protein